MKNAWRKNHISMIIGAYAFGLPIYPQAAPSTATFMNVMTVCGAGSSVKIDADLQGSIISTYEKEATRGRLSQQIIPEIAKILPQGRSYELYLDCVGRLIGRE
jgi:hypothetical protein